MQDDFLRILKEHIKRYPLMQPQDFGKLAYQSEFGPEHMISDKQRAHVFLMEEWKTLPKSSSPQITESIGGGLCRFPLSACASAEDVAGLAEVFVRTAKEHRGSMEGLMRKLEQVKQLEIPGMEAWAEEWRDKGCPPVHHSVVYRENYRPHYRLVRERYVDELKRK